MRKKNNQTKSKTRAIDRSPNDAGAIGDRIADLMLHPLNGTANVAQLVRPPVAKQLRTKFKGKGKARATERTRSRK